ncbi:MAG: DUF190 domain-containing protein [Nitrososphaerota archaeon]|nr:DUF190 domain-containing protein [Nitrososphaerota archaeon]
MSSSRPPMKRMLRLTVRARSHDQFRGRSLADSLLELYAKQGIGGATVVQGIKGYGVRGAAKFDVLGLSVNLPIIIETVGEYEKVQGVLASVKTMVGTNGLITLEEVNAF